MLRVLLLGGVGLLLLGFVVLLWSASPSSPVVRKWMDVDDTTDDALNILTCIIKLPVHGGGDLVQLQGDGGVPHLLAGTHNLPLLLTPHSPTPASTHHNLRRDHLFFEQTKTEQEKIVQVNFSEHVLVYH